jgi:hypothetical protein
MTKPEQFFITAKKTITVDMMQQEKNKKFPLYFCL